MKFFIIGLSFFCATFLKNQVLNAQLDSVLYYYNNLEPDNKENPQTITFIEEEMELVDDYSKLSQIILLRHGEPALDKKGGRKREEAIQFVKAYDSVGIYPPAFIPLNIEASQLNTIHTSSINRSISTAKHVFDREDLQQSDAMFREFELKIFSFPNIRLPLKVWLITSRVLWFTGLNKKGIESFSEAKHRAKKGADFLEQDALKNKKTLLVSHGLLNRYLAKYLKKRGWKEVYNSGHGYLSQKMLVKYEAIGSEEEE